MGDDVNTRLLKLLNDFCCDEVLHQDQNIQVDTLKFEQDRSVQADTLSPHIPDSGVFLSNITSPSTPDYLAQLESDDLHEGVSLPDLSEKSEEQISGELNRNILECSDHIRNLEETLDISDDLPYVHNEMKTCVKLLSYCHHISFALHTKYEAQSEDVREQEITELDERMRILRVRLTEKEKSSRGSSPQTALDPCQGPSQGQGPSFGQGLSYSEAVKSGSVSPGTTCPLCRRRNWRQLEGDLWRLERWLEHAERQLAQHLRNGVPSSIEQLEEVIQDHREFLLDLDSHKSVAMSINVVGCHLAEHSPTQTKAEAMRQRLATVNEKWDSVCEQATLWQTRLQTALLENGEFHQTILELQQWLDTTTETIREAEPVDLTVSRSILEAKHSKFLELLKDLYRCEPRVVSLQEAADQLELQADSASCKQVKKKLVVLSRSLRVLIRVCSVYLTSLSRALDIPPPPETLEHSQHLADSEHSLLAAVSHTGLPTLTQTLIPEESLDFEDQESPSSRGAVTRRSNDDVNTGVLSRSYRFLGRVVRAAVPIQALMLLLLGVSSIVPLDQEELICSLQNNLQRSLEPMMKWSHGPPPI